MGSDTPGLVPEIVALRLGSNMLDESSLQY